MKVSENHLENATKYLKTSLLLSIKIILQWKNFNSLEGVVCLKLSRTYYKLILTILFTIMSIFSALPMTASVEAEESSQAFRDVTYYQKEIEYLANLNIIRGYQDGTFRPTATVTRLQAVQMILRQLGIEDVEAPDVEFKDVKPGDYGYEEIAIAVDLGIVQGKDDGTFDPYGKLTRAQMAKIFANAYNLQGKITIDFTDVRKGHWAYDYVQALAANEVTTGYPDGSFRPNDPIKRMHFAAFMARYLNDEFKPPVTSPLTRKEVIEKKESVVMINTYDENGELLSQGSGFVTNNSLIVTNYHVISGGKSFEVITHQGEAFEIEGIVDYDFDNDIALLKTFERLPIKQLRIGSKEMVEQGDDVIAIGSPLGYYNTVSTGIVSGVRNFAENGWDADFIQFTAPVTFGSSGGPLFNMYGYVVGLVSFGYEAGDLNFALAADHVKELLSPYIGVPFYQLPIVPVDELPVIEEENPEDGTDPPTEPGNEEEPPVEETVDSVKFYLDQPLIDSVAHPSLPIIYGLDYYGNAVEINYETQEVKSISLPLPAERLYFANGELYITLLKGQHDLYWRNENQEGAIAVIDTSTFTLKESFDIDLDPFDIVVDDRYIYVSSGSGQWTYIKSYDLVTKQEVDSESIRNASYLEMHPNQYMIYAITTDTFPRDISVFTISSGQFTGTYDSPYHGDYQMTADMTISDDGKYIFNHIGTVFHATNLKSTNMTYVTSISPFTAIAFDQAAQAFYTGKDNKVTMYNRQTFEKINTWYVNGTIDHLFVRDGKMIAITTETPYSSNIPIQSVQIFEPFN
jgi:serine protease Do